MTSTSVTPDSVEATAGLLQSELPRLEERRQALEEELGAVSGRLESVRTALSALQALSLAPAVREAAETSASGPAEETGPDAADNTAGGDDAAVEATSAPAGVEETAAPARRAGRTTVPKQNSGRSGKREQQRPAKKSATAKETKTVAAKKKAQPVEPDAAVLEAGGLTEQVLAVLAASGGKPVRARDVAQVLGRDDSAGSVNAVRSTLDRLVATSRADRAGRGLYLSRA